MEECSFILENLVRHVLGEPDLEEMHNTYSSSLDDKRLSIADSREAGSNSSKNIARILPSDHQSEEL